MNEAGLAFHALRGYQVGDYVMTRPYGYGTPCSVDLYVRGELVYQDPGTDFYEVRLEASARSPAYEMQPCE